MPSSTQRSVPDADDAHYMRLALREAQRARRENEVPVGAVIVRNGRLLARAHNRPIHLHDPTAHAEILALRRVARKLGNYRLNECTLYVTIEPCVMCAGAIVHARLKRVVFGAADRKGGGAGSVLSVLGHPSLNRRLDVRSGVLEKDCAELLAGFFRAKRSQH